MYGKKPKEVKKEKVKIAIPDEITLKKRTSIGPEGTKPKVSKPIDE